MLEGRIVPSSLAGLSPPGHLAAPALVSNTGDSATLPFLGSAAETVTNMQPVGRDLLQLTITGTGQATHLGQFNGTETVVLNLGSGTFAGTRVFTAANGDQLYADVNGAFTSPTTAEGTLTFTGGTGRFASASGQTAFSAVTSDGINLTVTFTGAIAY
jgi:hypothetical protein